MYAIASGSDCGGVFMATSITGDRVSPAIAISTETPAKKRGAGPDRMPRTGEVIGADALGDENGGRHRDPERDTDQQEHHHVGVRGGRERRLAEKPPHPDGIDRGVEGLQDVGVEDGQGELHQTPADGAFGERAHQNSR